MKSLSTPVRPAYGERQLEALKPGGGDQRVTDLYLRFGPVIYSRCVRLLGDSAAAEDATQEVFVRVHRHIRKAPEAGSALPWIYRIATNYCLNELRNRKLRPLLFSEPPVRNDSGPTVEQVLVNCEMAAMLIDRASRKVRVVAWMHYVDGMEQAQVATVLGISRRTVINRLNEFKRTARKFLCRQDGNQ